MEKELVGPGGLEPPTPTMSRWCSNQLSYGPIQRVRILMAVTNQRKREERIGHKKNRSRASVFVLSHCEFMRGYKLPTAAAPSAA